LALRHQAKEFSKMSTVTEVCSGISAVSQGYEACGAKMVSYNELNPKFAAWLIKQGKIVIEGDVSCSQVIAQLAPYCGNILSGGIACQPWSLLGDQREMSDDRSRSMPGMLRAIHFLQIPLAVMECTPAVLQSKEAQDILRKFASETGMVVHQKILSLHPYWPSKHQRWWATLSHPALGTRPTPDMPPLAFAPSMIHLFPFFMELDQETLNELKLDDQEMDQFLSTPKGISEHQVNQLKPLPTATHSWGSQLRECLCGCRKTGFSQERIKRKGLYGQLLPLAEKCTKQQVSIPRMRHLHASEVADANGVDPMKLGLQDMQQRLALAAIGQCGSPFQSAWVMSNAMQDMWEAGVFPKPTNEPIEVMRGLAQAIFQVRDQLLKVQGKSESMQKFEETIKLQGNPRADSIIKEMTFDKSPCSSTDQHTQVAYQSRTAHPSAARTETNVEEAESSLQGEQLDALSQFNVVTASVGSDGCELPPQQVGVPYQSNRGATEASEDGGEPSDMPPQPVGVPSERNANAAFSLFQSLGDAVPQNNAVAVGPSKVGVTTAKMPPPPVGVSSNINVEAKVALGEAVDSFQMPPPPVGVPLPPPPVGVPTESNATAIPLTSPSMGTSVHGERAFNLPPQQVGVPSKSTADAMETSEEVGPSPTPPQPVCVPSKGIAISMKASEEGDTFSQWGGVRVECNAEIIPSRSKVSKGDVMAITGQGIGSHLTPPHPVGVPTESIANATEAAFAPKPDKEPSFMPPQPVGVTIESNAAAKASGVLASSLPPRPVGVPAENWAEGTSECYRASGSIHMFSSKARPKPTCSARFQDSGTKSEAVHMHGKQQPSNRKHVAEKERTASHAMKATQAIETTLGELTKGGDQPAKEGKRIPALQARSNSEGVLSRDQSGLPSKSTMDKEHTDNAMNKLIGPPEHDLLQACIIAEKQQSNSSKTFAKGGFRDLAQDTKEISQWT
jgi:site-specific DNA-cytosine methylase